MAGKNGKSTKTDTIADTVEQISELTEKNLEQAAQATENVEQQTAETVEEATATKPRGRKSKSEENQAEDSEADIGFSGKTFLIPYMLLMLRDSILHGYAIWEKLIFMGIPGLTESDRATIYRILRQLEREGKVKSEWDTTTAGNGPARRVYSLTDAGENFLKIWAVGLNQYRQSLDSFFKLYTGGVLPSPFDFKIPNSDFGKNSKGEK